MEEGERKGRREGEKRGRKKERRRRRGKEALWALILFVGSLWEPLGASGSL